MEAEDEGLEGIRCTESESEVECIQLIQSLVESWDTGYGSLIYRPFPVFVHAPHLTSAPLWSMPHSSR